MTRATRTPPKLVEVPFTEDSLDGPAPVEATRHVLDGDTGPTVALPEPPPGGWVTPADLARATANVGALSRWAIRTLADSTEPAEQIMALSALRAVTMASHDLPPAASRAMKPPPRPAAPPALAPSEIPVSVYRSGELLPGLDYDDELRAAALAVLAEDED